ncbi:putative ADP-dependent glucokinase [Dirofilaria immitis]
MNVIHQYIYFFKDERGQKRVEIDNRSSTLFIKRFFFIIVSNIIKKRLLIPTSVFRDVIIDGLKCCIVSEDTDLGKKLSALLYAVTEAIEKHYLRDFFILVSTEEAGDVDEVIEVYTLSFTYADGARLLLRSDYTSSHEIVLSCETVSELRKEVTALLLRLNVLMNILSPIPQSAFPYFKLIYYADTPNNYEPAGFKSSSTNYRFQKLTFISKISAGTFSTKFGGCSVYLESAFLGSASKQHDTEKNELQMLRRIIDETPTSRPKKDRVTVKVTEEDENNRSDLVHLRISSPVGQIKATADSSQENSDGIIESMRASLLEEDSPNESNEVGKIVSSCMGAVSSTTYLQKNDISLEYSGALPTVTELVDRGPVVMKDVSIRSPSSNTTIGVESNTAKKFLVRRSSNVETLPNTESKAKKMKISRCHVIVLFFLCKHIGDAVFPSFAIPPDIRKNMFYGLFNSFAFFAVNCYEMDFKDCLEMKILWWSAPYNQLLHLSLVFAIVPWLYSYFNEQHRKQSYSMEQAVMLAWDRVITQPTMLFRRVVIGINCNVDMVVTGTSLLERLNVTSTHRKDHEVISNVNDLYESFAYFFSRGAAAERHVSDPKMFQALVQFASEPRHRPHHYIGGNAALMAQKIATSFPRTVAYLVGPIGPRSQVLLHPSIVRTNSTRIVKDELHVIIEYKQGEILDEYVAPASSRFITSHDQYSGSAVVIEMFFKAINEFSPDLVILTGVHLLQNQNKEMRMEKLRLIKRSLLQIEHNIPIHFQLGNMGNPDHVAEVLNRIVPHVDSLGMNEQELAFFSNVGNGPYTNLYPVFPGAIHVHKVVEMLYWLITKFGHDSSDPESKNYKYRLSRIHFHSLTFHLMVYKGADWSNLAAGLAAGAKVAALQSCKITNDLNTDNLELRISKAHLLDKEVGKQYLFEPQRPLASWMRNDVVFIYTPALICKFPTRTVVLSLFFLICEMAFSRKHAVLNLLKQIRLNGRDTISTNGKSAKWLDDAVTYADVQTSFVDPCTSLPYPEKELHRFLENKKPKIVGKADNKFKDGRRNAGKLDFSQIPIEEQVVVLFPGQGAQHVGIGKKVMDCNKAIDVYKKASEILQYDLLKLCLEGPKSKLDQTIYCQPAIFVSSLAAWEKAKAEDETLSARTTDVAGFSVGEFAAFVLSEILSFEDALRLVKIRAEAMQQCSLRQHSGMITIRVNAATRLEEALEDARTYALEKNELPICEVANYLFCGVKVIGASENCIDFLNNNQEKYVFQVVKRLAVNGAFHTAQMKDAADTLKSALKDVKINLQPRMNIYSNYTGKLHIYKEKQIREAIIKQVYSPVKWEQIQQLLYAKQKDSKFPTFMEVGSGKQLGSMLLKIKIFSIRIVCL